MKKISIFLTITALLALGGTKTLAAETITQAKVLKISGENAQVLMPGESTPRSLKLDEELPQGATVITGANTEVYIQPMGGAVATIKPNTNVELEKLSIDQDGATITKQNAVLNLKSGNLVSSLDPNKRAINNYGVRTPKGGCCRSPRCVHPQSCH